MMKIITGALSLAGGSVTPIVIGLAVIAVAGGMFVIVHDARQAERGAAVQAQHETLEDDLKTAEETNAEIVDSDESASNRLHREFSRKTRP